jgi:type 1 fimbriae regulatory protein FimB/type 1 fimbriae regulatory protein FimE
MARFFVCLRRPNGASKTVIKIPHFGDSDQPRGGLMPAKLRLVSPASNEVLVTVGGRKTNKAMGRTREYLDASEVQRLIAVVKTNNRNGMRDALMIHMAERHGFRASELVELKRNAVNLERHTLHVTRKKGGVDTVHALDGYEVRTLRQLFRESPGNPYMFVSEQGTRFTRAGFQRLVERAGVDAGFDFPTHPHQLRHACGFLLANEGRNAFEIQQYMGHTSLEMTRKYCALSEGRFKDW